MCHKVESVEHSEDQTHYAVVIHLLRQAYKALHHVEVPQKEEGDTT